MNNIKNKINSKKIKTESNTLGSLKTLFVLILIAFQAVILILSYLYFIELFSGYFTFSIIMTLVACLHVLSSNYNGQAKATWIFFLAFSLGFGYIIYFLSSKRFMFAKDRKKYNNIIKNSKFFIKNNLNTTQKEIEHISNYLYESGNFLSYTNSKTTYYPTGNDLFDEIIENLKKAKNFIFIEYFIISNGFLLTQILNILKEKAKNGVDVRIIYDDMGSHRTLKRKTKKDIVASGIKLQSFNRLVPVFNIALNLRNHRKIVIIDGEISFTGGANLADEYINKKPMNGYWKDCGIKIEGSATNNFTRSFLQEWQFLTNNKINYEKFITANNNTTKHTECIIPFVSGPNYSQSIAQNSLINLISNAKEKLYIMTPYFIPDETITNLIINKAQSGVNVKIILPEISDKKFVYIVTRNNAEKLIKYGVQIYTANNSFVHSKVFLTDTYSIVGSINLDLRSFNQQFESAVLTTEKQTLNQIHNDFIVTLSNSTKITNKNMKRKKLSFRMLAGVFNIISPFM